GPALFADEDREAGVADLELQKAAEVGVFNNERWTGRKDGSRFYAAVMTTALKNEAGKVVGFSRVLRDTTERKRAADALRETAERKDEFLAMLAHELRNPLGPIGNAIHMLAGMTPHNKDVARLTDIVKRQVTH